MVECKRKNIVEILDNTIGSIENNISSKKNEERKSYVHWEDINSEIKKIIRICREKIMIVEKLDS